MSIVLNYFAFYLRITLSTAFLTVFSKNPIHSAIYLVICFFSIAGTLFIIECTIFSYSSCNCLFWSDYDFVFIHHYVNEFE
jgi:NADH:ubiquinone oxidoreductase subunit 6 (subunit J)